MKKPLPPADDVPLDEEYLRRLQPATPAKLARLRAGMSQERFAETYHIPLGTLRDWEQHKSQPDGAAKAYLKAIWIEPQTVARLVALDAPVQAEQASA